MDTCTYRDLKKRSDKCAKEATKTKHIDLLVKQVVKAVGRRENREVFIQNSKKCFMSLLEGIIKTSPRGRWPEKGKQRTKSQ